MPLLPFTSIAAATGSNVEGGTVIVGEGPAPAVRAMAGELLRRRRWPLRQLAGRLRRRPAGGLFPPRRHSGHQAELKQRKARLNLEGLLTCRPPLPRAPAPGESTRADKGRAPPAGERERERDTEEDSLPTSHSSSFHFTSTGGRGREGKARRGKESPSSRWVSTHPCGRGREGAGGGRGGSAFFPPLAWLGKRGSYRSASRENKENRRRPRHVGRERKPEREMTDREEPLRSGGQRNGYPPICSGDDDSLCRVSHCGRCTTTSRSRSSSSSCSSNRSQRRVTTEGSRHGSSALDSKRVCLNLSSIRRYSSRMNNGRPRREEGQAGWLWRGRAPVPDGLEGLHPSSLDPENGERDEDSLPALCPFSLRRPLLDLLHLHT